MQATEKKMKTKLLLHNRIKCKKCGDIVESKYTHDYVFCSCGVCAADGGLDYLKRSGDLKDWEDLSEYNEVEITPKYKVGDVVIFDYFGNTVKGKIQMIDLYPNSTIVEYDILDESEPRLYKHFMEKDIIDYA